MQNGCEVCLQNAFVKKKKKKKIVMSGHDKTVKYFQEERITQNLMKKKL